MPLFGICVVCEQEKEGKRYRRVTPESKEKEGILNLKLVI